MATSIATLTTVKDYCTLRGVSRQFVYEYIRKGKFQMLELPTYVEFGGEKVEVGKQKFLQVPPQYAADKKTYWSGDVNDDDYAINMAADATEDIEIRHRLTHFLSLQDSNASDKYKKYLLEIEFPIGHSKRPALDTAFKKCIDLMTAELADLEQNVGRLGKN